MEAILTALKEALNAALVYERAETCEEIYANWAAISILQETLEAYICGIADGSITPNPAQHTHPTSEVNSYDGAALVCLDDTATNGLNDFLLNIDNVLVSLKNKLDAIRLINNGDGSFTFYDEDGIPTVFDANTYLVDNGNGTFTFTPLSGLPTVFDANNDLVNNGDGTFAFTNLDGTTVNFDAVTEVIDNGNGTITFNLLDGTTVVFNTVDTLADNNDGTWTFTDNGGGVTTLDICKAIKDSNCYTTATVVGNTLTITPPEGAPIVFNPTFTETTFSATSSDNTITITPAGTAGHTPNLQVKIDPDTNNCLEVRTNGLFSKGVTYEAAPTGCKLLERDKEGNLTGNEIDLDPLLKRCIGPVAEDDNGTTPQEENLTGNVLPNDTSPTGESYTVTSNTAPSNGSVVIASNGVYTYTPDIGFAGNDSFTYTITDSVTGQTDTATVYITVTPKIPLATITASGPNSDQSFDLTLVNTDFEGKPLLVDDLVKVSIKQDGVIIQSGTHNGTENPTNLTNSLGAYFTAGGNFDFVSWFVDRGYTVEDAKGYTFSICNQTCDDSNDTESLISEVIIGNPICNAIPSIQRATIFGCAQFDMTVSSSSTPSAGSTWVSQKITICDKDKNEIYADEDLPFNFITPTNQTCADEDAGFSKRLLKITEIDSLGCVTTAWLDINPNTTKNAGCGNESTVGFNDDIDTNWNSQTPANPDALFMSIKQTDGPNLYVIAQVRSLEGFKGFSATVTQKRAGVQVGAPVVLTNQNTACLALRGWVTLPGDCIEMLVQYTECYNNTPKIGNLKYITV